VSLKRSEILSPSCQQNGDLPNSPLNNRQLLPSVGTIILSYWIFFGA
jgi:hypothetical protein